MSFTAYPLWCIMLRIAWTLTFASEFDAEYQQMNTGLQNALLSHLVVLEKFGPRLGRPKADTLHGSVHANMKELRFNHDGGVWRGLTHLILIEKVSCWLPVIKAVKIRGVFTNE